MRLSRFLLPIILLTALIGAWFLWRRGSSARLPKTLQRPTAESILNIHGSPKHGLQICGKDYWNIKGGPPYWTGVSNSHIILFAYQPSSYEKTLVVCDTSNCSFLEIDLRGVRFGDRIGYWEATKGQIGDIAESWQSNRITLLSKSRNYTERSIVDLTKGTIQVIEIESERFSPRVSLLPLETNAPQVKSGNQ